MDIYLSAGRARERGAREQPNSLQTHLAPFFARANVVHAMGPHNQPCNRNTHPHPSLHISPSPYTTHERCTGLLSILCHVARVSRLPLPAPRTPVEP